ncbi:MAG TPA: FecR family protein [Planctomycetota bacterium]
MTDDLQLLISDYLNGEEVDALRDRLASDPKALTEFVLALDVHGELRKIFLEGKGNAAALKEIRLAKRWRWVAAAAVAATALVAWALLGRSTSLPRVESLAGNVRPAVAVGQEISDLETLGDGRATLKYPDGTSLVLGPGTRVRELAPNRVSLTRGSLAAEVTPRADPLVFSTPHGDAKVLGTSLKLAVEKASTRLEVTEGRVRLTRGGDAVDVAAGHFAVAAGDVKPEAKTLVAERIRRLAPNAWLALPGTKLRPVAAKAKGDPRGVMESWSGAVLDTRRNRLVVWGGGHTNYYGNEVYAFDLASLRWERLTEPSPVTAGSQVCADGTPSARGTYNGLAYVAHADRMFALGGDPAGSGPTPDLLWTFDFADHAWENRQPSGDRPPTWVGALSAYDPATRKVWWGEGRSPGIAGLYAYEVDANRWVKHTADFFYYQTGALDTRRGLLVCAGDGKLFAHDVRKGAPIRQAWGEAFVGISNPGFDYDAKKDRLVAWAGGPVRVLHPETRAWTVIDAPGAPKPTPNGIFGRWRYVPSLDVFVVVTDIDDDVHFFKLGD